MYSVKYLIFLFVPQIIAVPCKTPNGEQAECVPITNCSHILDAIKNHEEESIKFARQSQCGFEKEPLLVCCDSDTNFKISPLNINVSSSTTIKPIGSSLIPDRRFCGIQHVDGYIYEGNGTAISEIPWVVILKYRRRQNPDVGTHCSGSLISRRYVLTSGSCIVEDRATDLEVSSVQLGEYNTKNEQDCVEVDGLEECSDPILELGIEEIIVHPEYRPKINNIGLIRLNKTVVFTDYIRPICLPFPAETTFANVGELLVSSGWGAEFRNSTLLKKRAFNRIISNEVCEEEFRKWRTPINDGHMCTIYDYSRSSEFACADDGGGGLTFKHNNQWHIEGIYISGGGCGSNTTLVSTRVSKYLDWIVSVIRA